MKRADAFPSKYLSAHDLPEEGVVVTIKRFVEAEEMNDGPDKPVAYLREFEKGMIINVTKWNVLEKLYGDDSDGWIGKRISIYPSETLFKTEMKPCINIRNKPPKPASSAKPAKIAAPTREPGDDDEPEDEDDPGF